MTLYIPKRQKRPPNGFRQDPCFNQSNKPEGETTTETVEIPRCLLFPRLNRKSEDENVLEEGTIFIFETDLLI